MAAREILAGNAVVEVGTRLAIQRGLKEAEDHFRKFGATVGKIGGAAVLAGSAAVAGAAAAFAPLLAAAKQFADVGSELDDMSQRTGASVEALSALGYAARQSGASLGAVEGGIKKTQKAIADAIGGNKQLTATFESLNLQADELAKLAPDQQFRAIAAAVGAVEDPTQRAAVAMQLFGKSGTELLPLMRSDISELTDEAKKLGLVMSGENASAAAALGDAIDKAGDVIQATWLSIGAAVAPILTDILDQVVGVVSEMNHWIQSNADLVQMFALIAAGVGIVGTALVITGGLLIGMGYSLSAMGTIASTVYAGITLASGIATAATTLLGGAVTATAVAEGTLAASTGVATVATGIFGSVVTAVLAPLYAMIGTVGAIVLGVAALVAIWAGVGIYIAAQAGLISDAMGWLGTRFAELLGTAKKVLSGVLGALSAGQYVLAAQILWAGIKLAFWQGADMALEGVTALFSNFLMIQHRFITKMIEMLWRGFKAIPGLLKAALTGSANLPKILETIFAGGMDLGGVLDGQVSKARKDLDALTAQVKKPKPDRQTNKTANDAAQAAKAAQAIADSAAKLALPRVPAAAASAVGPQAAGQKREADTLESLRAARIAHNQRAYRSQAEAFAAEQELNNRERVFMATKMNAAAQARADLAAASAAKPKPIGEPAKVDRLTSAIDSTQKEMKFSSVGTFSAAAAGLIGGSATDERVAGNTAQTVSLLRKLYKQKQRGPSYA